MSTGWKNNTLLITMYLYVLVSFPFPTLIDYRCILPHTSSRLGTQGTVSCFLKIKVLQKIVYTLVSLPFAHLGDDSIAGDGLYMRKQQGNTDFIVDNDCFTRLLGCDLSTIYLELLSKSRYSFIYL